MSKKRTRRKVHWLKPKARVRGLDDPGEDIFDEGTDDLAEKMVVGSTEKTTK